MSRPRNVSTLLIGSGRPSGQSRSRVDPETEQSDPGTELGNNFS
jgi:hypothetical protein